MARKRAVSAPKPAKTALPSRADLLGKLPGIKYERPEKTDRDKFEQVHLAASLRLLAELSAENGAAATRAAAQHLLGYVPEPDDADLGEQ